MTLAKSKTVNAVVTESGTLAEKRKQVDEWKKTERLETDGCSI